MALHLTRRQVFWTIITLVTITVLGLLTILALHGTYHVIHDVFFNRHFLAVFNRHDPLAFLNRHNLFQLAIIYRHFAI